MVHLETQEKYLKTCFDNEIRGCVGWLWLEKLPWTMQSCFFLCGHCTTTIYSTQEQIRPTEFSCNFFVCVMKTHLVLSSGSGSVWQSYLRIFRWQIILTEHSKIPLLLSVYENVVKFRLNWKQHKWLTEQNPTQTSRCSRGVEVLYIQCVGCRHLIRRLQ